MIDIHYGQEAAFMKAIILAAGSGSRLAPLTRDTPKCLLDMGNGTSILEYQLWACAQCCIEEVVVIAGPENFAGRRTA